MTRVLLMLALLVGAAVAGFVGYRVLTGHEAGSPAKPLGPPPPVVASPPGPQPLDAPNPEPAPSRRVPDVLPDNIVLSDLKGAQRNLVEWKGRPLIVNFWATWCEPCRREIPLLQSLRRAHKKSRLEIIGIAIDTREAVAPYVKKAAIDYPVLVGEEEGLEAAEAFGVGGVLPFSIFADKLGRIVAIRVGELHDDEARFILSQLTAVDAGSLDVGTAKRAIGDELKRLAVLRAGGEAS